MPQVIPAVASFATSLYSSAVLATAAAVSGTGLGWSASVAVAEKLIVTAALTAASVGLSVMMRPSTPSSGTTLDFKPDTKAPVTGMMGYCATGGNKVFQSTWGYNNVALSLGCALSLGPIDAITQFRADDKVVTFTGPQNEATGFYAADMWQKTTLGLPTDSALLPPTGLKYGSPPLSGWGSQNAAKGVAFAFWTMVLAKNPEDRNIFVNGVPDPLWVGRWMKVYDWRKDSTYPGGSGSHREDDWRTWEWSENPILHARAFIRGHFKMKDDGFVDYAYRIAGIGIMPHAIDMDAFTEAANVSDANGWKIAGSWSSADNKWDTLVAMLKAGGAVPIQNGAKISVMVNTPRVSTATITRDDVVGEIQVSPLVRRRERKNTIVPRYRSEAHSWEYVPAGAVTSAVYRAEDRNELRSLEVQYTYVRLPKQAAELAAYDLANMREGIKVTATLKVDAMSIKAGDCITFNVPEVGLENQKVIVLRKSTDYQSATVTIECRSETDAKHAWALGQAANPPPSPSLSANDPNYMPPPLAADWNVDPQLPTDGKSQPVIIVTGPIDRGDIASVVVEYGLTNDGPWLSAGPADPSTGKYSINGLQPQQQYWVSIRYVANNGTISERYVTGPHTAPDLVAEISPNSPVLQDLEDQLDELFDTTAIIEGDLASAELLLNDVNAEVVAARGGQSNLNARIAQVNQARIDGDSANASAISAVQLEVENARDGEASLAAKISNIDTAIANETSARATAIGLVEAKLVPPVNEYANADLSNGTVGFAPLWGFSGPLPTVTSDGNEIAAFKAGGNWNGTETLYFIVGLYGGGHNITVTGLGARTCWKVAAGDRIGFAVDGRTRSGSARWSFDMLWCDVGSNNVTSMGVSVTGYGNNNWQRVGRVGTVPGEGYVWVEGTATLGWDGSLGIADMALRRPTFARLSPTATALPAYTAPANGLQIGELSASVRENSLAIVGIEAQQALASWEVVAAASGGKPARLKVVSSSLGSAVALDAPYVYFGDNTVFEDATDTLVTTVGSTRYITAWGAPFGPDNLTYWVGPNTIPTASATKANAGVNGQWRDSSGASFFGGATLSGPFDSGPPSSTPINLPKDVWTTIAEVPSKYFANTGYASTLVNFDLWVSGAPSSGGPFYDFEYRVVVVDQGGGSPVVINGNFGALDFGNTWSPRSASWPISTTQITTTWGDKRIRLQIRPTGVDISTAQARNGRVRGIYGA